VTKLKINAEREPRPHSDEPWNLKVTPGVKELLDHLAEELADEYLRLMKSEDAESGQKKNFREDQV
jgi:hypothetical protein